MCERTAKCMLVWWTLGWVETRRLGVIRSHGLVDKPGERIPMTMFWLLPQFLLLAMLDGAFERSMDLFYEEQAPKSMRANPAVVTKALVGLGTMGSVLSTYVAGKVSQVGGKPNWFQDTLSRSRLDNYYWTLAVLSSVDFFLGFLFSCFFPYRFKRPGRICLVGIENAGKSSLVNVIATGEYKECMEPTVEFNLKNVTIQDVEITLFDLGGQPKFRSTWKYYCRDASAIVYVVDAADHEKVNISRSKLHDLFSKQRLLSGIPLLVIGNKIDKPRALSEEALTEQMGLESITEREKCCIMISCRNSTNIDSVIDWLIKHSKSKKELDVDV